MQRKSLLLALVAANLAARPRIGRRAATLGTRSAIPPERHDPMAKRKPDKQPRVSNRKARFQYDLLDRVEAGIMLRGAEVKSLRQGQASLEEAYARVQGGEIYLINCHIKAYEHGDVQSQDPLRPRKLLLHKRELRKLIPKVEQRGLTLVPVAIYFNERGLAKVDLALARGKARRDKRQDLKRRQQERDIRAALKKR